VLLSKANSTAFFTALAAAIGYGGWAVFANYEHGVYAWVVAGFIQASYAFFSTFFITHVAKWTFIKYDCGFKGILAGFGTSFIVMLAIPLLVHSIFHTPDLWQTILPGLIWGSIYLLGVLFSLNASHKKEVNRKK
jgi:hypothetical protein